MLDKIPYTLAPVIATGDDVHKATETFCKELMPKPLSGEKAELIKCFVDIPIDTIITTNYSYELESAILPNFECKEKVRNKWRKTTIKGNNAENQYGIFKYYDFDYQSSPKHIWHIHGEAARPSSVVIGHYYYCNLLNKIHSYASKCIARYKTCLNKKLDFQPYSWIDYFLLGDVHMIGYGLNLSEIDIWWLINLKKREFSDCGKIHLYDNNIEDPIKLLSKCYNVEVFEPKDKISYIDFYKDTLSKIAKTL
ncbi:MAG: SIR2 family protein [Lachnospiraceae bacterium]|nr:SIR2 family protein [Lachnospiraceae bacterium]